MIFVSIIGSLCWSSFKQRDGFSIVLGDRPIFLWCCPLICKLTIFGQWCRCLWRHHFPIHFASASLHPGKIESLVNFLQDNCFLFLEKMCSAQICLRYHRYYNSYIPFFMSLRRNVSIRKTTFSYLERVLDVIRGWYGKDMYVAPRFQNGRMFQKGKHILLPREGPWCDPALLHLLQTLRRALLSS